MRERAAMSVVAGPAPADGRDRGLRSAPLIGREREFGLLVEAVLAPPSVVIVEGEAGIGKSRLMGELLGGSALAGRRLLVGYCHRLREPFPLGPVIEALRGVGDDLPRASLSPVVGALLPLLPELGAWLPAQPEVLADPRAQRHRVFRALRELLEALGPVVCVLEDLHWDDGGTLEFLSFLLSDPPKELALVLTCRGEGLDRCDPLFAAVSRVARATIELGPLCVNEVGALAAALLGEEDVSREFAGYLRARSGGIPFAVEELVRVFCERGDVSLVGGDGAGGGPEELAVPDAVRRAVLERFEPLGGDARSIARAAAVLGGPADEELLCQVAGIPASRATKGLVGALDAGVLEEQVRALYGFRHVLAMQAVHEDVPTPLRRCFHLRAARALQSRCEPRPLAQIAHHFKEAGRPRQWVRYAELAAEAAHGVADDRSAAALLTEALQAPALPRAARVRMARALGIAALYSTSAQAAIAALERVLEVESLPTGVRGELRFSLCRLRFHAGQTDGWREQMLLAVQELRRRPELAACALINLAWPRYWDGEAGDPVFWLRLAERTAARQHDAVTNIAVAAQRAAILLVTGDQTGWDAIADIPTEACSVDEKLELLRGHATLTAAALSLGHYRRAERFLAEAERIKDDLGHEDWEVLLTGLRVSLDWAVGRWDGLEPRAGACGAEIVVARLLLARGELEQATEHIESALHAARSTGSITGISGAEGARARLLLLRDDPHAARRAALVGVDVVRRTGIWIWGTGVVPEAVDALLACGEHDQATALVREFAIGLRGRDAPAGTAALAGCRGALAEADGRYCAAALHFSHAERGLRALPAPYAAGRAQCRQARCRFGGNDPRGGELLLGALEEFERLGASWDAARVRSACRTQGVTLPYPWRGGRKEYGNGLSPREVEVARLAGLGKTNREIAEALVLSRNTVKHHVSSALRKLQIGSRNDLALVVLSGTSSQN